MILEKSNLADMKSCLSKLKIASDALKFSAMPVSETTFVFFQKWTKQKNTGQSLPIKITLRSFLPSNDKKVKEKIIWTFLLIEEIEQVPQTCP